MMDIDYFKRYNDTYGHPAGDAVLKEAANSATLDKLIEYADGCLYQSKEAGRNRVTVKTLR